MPDWLATILAIWAALLPILGAIAGLVRWIIRKLAARIDQIEQHLSHIDAHIVPYFDPHSAIADAEGTLPSSVRDMRRVVESQGDVAGHRLDKHDDRLDVLERRLESALGRLAQIEISGGD